MQKITILDYGIGNLLSVKRAVEFHGMEVKLGSTENDIKNSSHIIIPGVGSFAHAINSLRSNHTDQHIINHVKKGFPVLGICLGMQLLSEFSFEGGKNRGLGLIEGNVQKLTNEYANSIDPIKVPNIGWRKVNCYDPQNSVIFDQNTNNREYYHVHSFHFIPKNKKCIIGTSKFGNSEIAVALKKDNIFGTQFHPEKSGKNGLNILKNFLEIKL